MFLLEDRVLFDGALAADISESSDETAPTVEVDGEDSFEGSSQNNTPETSPPSDVDDTEPTSLANINSEITTPDVAGIKIVLISDDLDPNLANALENSAAEGVETIRFDPKTCTSSQLLAQIQRKLEDGQKISSIGVAAETNQNGFLTLLQKDSDTEFWTEISKDYLAEDGRVDLFYSATEADSSQFIKSFESVLTDDQQVCYSETEIGNGDDANWTLENGDIDLNAEYFDSNISDEGDISFGTTEAESSDKVLVVVSNSVRKSEEILDHIEGEFDVLHLGSSTDPLGEIIDYLEKHGEHKTLEFYCHGDTDYFVLNGHKIDSDLLETSDHYRAQFQEMGKYLATDADIMIHSCKTGASLDGQNLMATLHELTGADIAVNGTVDPDGIANVAGFSVYGILQKPFFHNLDHYSYRLQDHEVTTSDDSSTPQEGSLRYYIANSESGDSITFSKDLSDKTISIVSSLVINNKDLTISGYGNSREITIASDPNGSQDFSLFKIVGGTEKPTVTIKNLTLQGGYDSSPRGPENGGGIYAQDTDLALENVTITDCLANINGAGIFSQNTDLTLTDVRITDCFAGKNGGGICATGITQFTINGCTIKANYTIEKGDAIFVRTDIASITISNLHEVDNSSSNGTGGASVWIENSDPNADADAIKLSLSETCIISGGLVANEGITTTIEGSTYVNKLIQVSKLNIGNGNTESALALWDGVKTTDSFQLGKLTIANNASLYLGNKTSGQITTTGTPNLGEESTIVFNSPQDQTIENWTYGNLICTNGTKKIATSTEIRGDFSAEGSVEVNDDLNVAGRIINDGTFKLADNKTLTLYGDFTNKENATFTSGSNSMVKYAGDDNQAIASGMYYNILCEGSGIKSIDGEVTANANFNVFSGTALRLGESAIVTVKGTFNHNGDDDFDPNSTFEDARSGDVDIVKLNNGYGNLICSGNGTKTIANNLVVKGELSVEGTTNLTLAENKILTIYGDFIKGSDSVVKLNKDGAGIRYAGVSDSNGTTGDQQVLDATYYNLTLDGNGIKTLSGDVTVNNGLQISKNVQVKVLADKTLTLEGIIITDAGSGDSILICEDGAKVKYLTTSTTQTVLPGEYYDLSLYYTNKVLTDSCTVKVNNSLYIFDSTFTLHQGSTLILKDTISTAGSGSLDCKENSTVIYAKNGVQDMVAGNYHHLTISGTSQKRTFGNINVDGKLTVDEKNTFYLAVDMKATISGEATGLGRAMDCPNSEFVYNSAITQNILGGSYSKLTLLGAPGSEQAKKTIKSNLYVEDSLSVANSELIMEDATKLILRGTTFSFLNSIENFADNSTIYYASQSDSSIAPLAYIKTYSSMGTMKEPLTKIS